MTMYNNPILSTWSKSKNAWITPHNAIQNREHSQIMVKSFIYLFKYGGALYLKNSRDMKQTDAKQIYSLAKEPL